MKYETLLKRSIKLCLRRKSYYEIRLLFILLLVLQFAATIPRRCVLEKILVTGQLLLSERFSWKIGALDTEGGRVNNNKISNYLAQTNYRLDVRLGFPDYVTAYAPHNLQGRLEHFSCPFSIHRGIIICILCVIESIRIILK